MNTLAVDTNIIIAALIKNGIIRKILTDFKINFLFPDYGIGEIYKYKEEIKTKANMNEKEFNILLLRILKYIKLVPLDIIAKHKEESDNIMKNIDKDDSVFIATALAFNCSIWSEDNHFKKQNKIKVITTKDLLKILK